MSTTVMALKTDKTLKEQAQKIAKQLGFSLGTLLNAFMRQFVRDKEIAFSAAPQEKLRPEIELLLEEVERDIQQGKNISPAFATGAEAVAYLKKHRS